MKNQILRVSVKFGLILGGVYLILGLINTFTFNPENLSLAGHGVLTGIILYGLIITFLVMAHYEYNKKNEDYISFKDAILIGLIIIGIFFSISTLYNIVSSEFIMKEKMQLYYSNMNEQYGSNIGEGYYSSGKYIWSLIVMLWFQIILLFLIITVESLWKIYKKAGKEGWASIVPIYNIIVLLEIVKKPVWWIVLLLIPFVNIVFAIWMTNLLSMRFGKDEGFTIGLIFLPYIFYPLLGLSKAEYINE